MELSNILKDINKNCKKCDSPKDFLKFLFNRGDISPFSEYHREVYFFYLETLDTYPYGRNRRMLARQETCQMFKISEHTLKRIITKYRKKYR